MHRKVVRATSLEFHPCCDSNNDPYAGMHSGLCRTEVAGTPFHRLDATLNDQSHRADPLEVRSRTSRFDSLVARLVIESP